MPWSDWVPYNPNYQWQLEPHPDDGLFHVSFQTRDFVENIAPYVTKLIDVSLIDTTPPTASVLINDGASYISSPMPFGPSVDLDLFALDNIGGSGVKDVRFSYDNSDWSDWFDWQEDTVDVGSLTPEELAVWDYFNDGYYPTGSVISANSLQPSQSLIDAMVADGTLYYYGDSRELFIIDHTQGIMNDDYYEFTIGITDVDVESLRVTLAWQDEFMPVTDDLDLYVIPPGSRTFQHIETDENIEQLEFTTSYGPYTIRVHAENLFDSDILSLQVSS